MQTTSKPITNNSQAVKSNHSPLFWRALKKSPFFITKTENAYDL